MSKNKPTTAWTERCETCDGSGWRMVGTEPRTMAGVCGDCQGEGVIEGAPTGLKCDATNSGVPNYLRCGRPLYRYATSAGLIDQCPAGHMSSVEAQDD